MVNSNTLHWNSVFSFTLELSLQFISIMLIFMKQKWKELLDVILQLYYELHGPGDDRNQLTFCVLFILCCMDSSMQVCH